jgi:hypothetical protein
LKISISIIFYLGVPPRTDKKVFLKLGVGLSLQSFLLKEAEQKRISAQSLTQHGKKYRRRLKGIRI